MRIQTVPESAQDRWAREVSRLRLLLLVVLLGVGGIALAEPTSEPTSGPVQQARWQEIRSALFGDRQIHEADGLIALETPYRALDAAVVPIVIKAAFEQTPERYIKDVHLVIDMNPAPVAGVFHFPGDRPWSSLETRVRVDRYSHIRAIAETSDGELYMAANFVKASGGCSAPSSKDPAAAEANLGRMKVLWPQRVEAGAPLALQLLIRHPNSSGLQFDQIARRYIPPDYLQEIELDYAGRPLLRLDGNISISEDPSIRLTFVPNTLGELAVRARDSSGRAFAERFSAPTTDGG